MQDQTYTYADLANACSVGRTDLKRAGNDVQELIAVAKRLAGSNPDVDGWEVIANATLAYRHLEDAAMRLGKAIQAIEGGKSIYDTNDAKRVAENGPVDPGNYSETKA